MMYLNENNYLKRRIPVREINEIIQTAIDYSVQMYKNKLNRIVLGDPTFGKFISFVLLEVMDALSPYLEDPNDTTLDYYNFPYSEVKDFLYQKFVNKIKERYDAEFNSINENKVSMIINENIYLRRRVPLDGVRYNVDLALHKISDYYKNEINTTVLGVPSSKDFMDLVISEAAHEIIRFIDYKFGEVNDLPEEKFDQLYQELSGFIETMFKDRILKRYIKEFGKYITKKR